MDRPKLEKVLCVDDELAVLEGLKLSLRRKFEVLTATSGPEGLELLGKTPDVTVILSDMRMPGMDGAAFLKASRTFAPDATRVLLTGEADLPSAIAAINKGRIFRFLCKPCPPAELAEAMSAAAEQHRLVTAERVLLEETLQGSIAALADVLAQTHPASFGRALRVKLLVGQLSEMAGLRSHWQVEIAATLSQLAAVTLPPETLAAWEAGETLRPEEQEMVARMPAFTDRVLSRIPRLEGVRRILADYAKHPHELDPTDAGQLTREARILRLAMDYDRFVAGGMSVELALAALGSCGDLYDADLLGFLGLLAQAARELELRRIPPKDLLPGMVLAEEIRTQGGVLLAARGYQISDSFVARISNLRAGTLHALLAVMVPAARP